MLVFHHKDPEEKEFKMSSIFGFRWSIIEKEVLKCQLLCYNCHREKHNLNKETVYNKSKKTILSMQSVSGCEMCGYNDYVGALEFHHERDKKINLGLITICNNSSERILNKLENELNKCKVLCANCHQDLHFDKEKFKLIENEIKNYSYNELLPSLNEKEVMDLYNSGMRQLDIAKKFGRNTSVICRIIQRNKKK